LHTIWRTSANLEVTARSLRFFLEDPLVWLILQRAHRTSFQIAALDLSFAAGLPPPMENRATTLLGNARRNSA
jgi:hypothetical protein